LLLGSDYFTMEVETDFITMTLNAETNDGLGTYNYLVEITAEGGAKGLGTSKVNLVESDCIGVINTDFRGFHKSFSFDVPNSETCDTETFPFASVQYVSQPPVTSVDGYTCL
jgi:hypothetical protein